MIEIRDIHKKYGNKTVLNGVSFSVSESEIYGLIGKNGAGKTTLMTIISNLEMADQGECIYGKNTISYLPDIPGFFDYLTCEEYLDFLLLDYSGKKRQKRNDLLKMVSIDGKNVVKTLSRGMRQRLGIAAALVNDPDILLLDEPTSALDPAGRMELKDILIELKNRGKSILLSTHILADMETTCDRVGFLHNGRIEMETTVFELIQQDALTIQFGNPLSFLPKFKHVLCKAGEDSRTISFIISASDSVNGQKELFKFISELDNPIISIKNKSKSLDDLFKEVCSK